MSYFFGKYAFGNPDIVGPNGNLNCWAPNTAVGVNATNFAILPDNATHEGWIDVTSNFLVWFEWGFILQMMTVGAILCGMLIFCAPKFAASGSSCVLGLQQCGGLAWFITGMVLRWRQAGNICSGKDLSVMGAAYEGAPIPGVLYSSGNFINVWLIINLSFMGCCCVTGCVMMLVAKCAAR